MTWPPEAYKGIKANATTLYQSALALLGHLRLL